MKKSGLTSDAKRLLAMTLTSLVFAVGSIFLLSGCTITDEKASVVTPPVQQGTSQPESTSPAPESSSPEQDATNQEAEDLQPFNHIIDIDPEPLAEDATAMTLEGYGAKGALADQDLTINDMLTYAAQDEYLAHGEYVAIVEKFGNQRPYTNIIKSEETHLKFLEEVYLTYGLTFPGDSSAEHIVIPATLLEAAQTGVQAEIDNIAMYERFLTYDLPDNVQQVFTALMNGSQSHLQAFQKQVDRLS